ncbi:hypothetical protein [Pseudomonas fluorescens]|uniref:hypothetical protein n=1 Tax=Pseudomonas fluorescens TaxID=294 RepID=UPI001783F28A|nr:hypothetical protein [Pseudomonas fluorescens]
MITTTAIKRTGIRMTVATMIAGETTIAEASIFRFRSSPFKKPADCAMLFT